MSRPAKPKKSESLEIRLPYTTKTAFMARCRDEGRSASDAVRDFIDGYIEPAPAPAKARRSGGLRLAVAAAAVAALAGFAAPTLARPVLASTTLDAEFKRLDKNGDGRLSLEEFRSAERRH